MSERVEPYDHFRYQVRSFSGDQPYLVDIAAHDWIGQCDCPHWIARLGPKVRTGERLRCKHIMAAREVALDDIGPRLQKAIESKKV